MCRHLVVQHPSIEGLRDYDLVGAGLKPALSLHNANPTPYYYPIISKISVY